MVDGQRRLQNIRTKVRIVAQRDMRRFLADEIAVLPCTRDYEDSFIAREFDRLAKARGGDDG